MKQKLTITDDGRRIGAKRLYHILSNLDEGEWEVTVEKWKDSRSLRQNNLYWKWLTIIGNELGYYKDEIHELFIEEFADIYTIRDLDGKPKQKRYRTSKMNVQQMSRYMNRIEQFAAEYSIQLPHPEDDLLKAT